jgi:hypothetical protein
MPKLGCKLLGHDSDVVPLCFTAGAPQPLTGRADKAGHAAKLSGQLFQERFEPALLNRLTVAGFLRQENSAWG